MQYSVGWGLLAFLPVYAAGVFRAELAKVFEKPEVGTTVLSVVMGLVLLSWVVTLAAFARIRKRVTVLGMQAKGETVAAAATVGDRMVDALVPDSVMVNTFPQTNVTTALMDLTGHRPARIRVPGYRASSRDHHAGGSGRTAWP